MSSVMSLQEENRVLQGELARLEDLLAHSRADRDELAIKYSAISERVRQQAQQSATRKANILPSYLSSSNVLLKVKKLRSYSSQLCPFTIEAVLVFLCLRSAGHPGDGGWYELECDVAMVSVTPGDSQQALQWRFEDSTFHFRLNIFEENVKGLNPTMPKNF